MKPSHHRRRKQRDPLPPHEYMRRRRDRRMDRNANASDSAQRWAIQNGFVLRVHNDGHHWLWQKPGFVAEWWPSSAKFVLNRNYDRSFHVHDWTGVIPFLEGRAGVAQQLKA